MYGLDTIHKMNNESGETLDGKAQTYAEIREAARQEGIDAIEDNVALDDDYGDGYGDETDLYANDWPEPRNDR